MPAVNRIRIRMYRVGFGDCFLISLLSAGGARHILIDCGVHPRGDIRTIGRVVAGIAEVTGRKLAVIAATHAHRDHIGGFAQFAAEFRRFEVGEVWLPWTENPADPQASRLKAKRIALTSRIGIHFNSLPLSAQKRFHGAMAAVANMSGNEPAMAQLTGGFGTGAVVRFLEAGAALHEPCGVEGLNVRLLGPPREPEFLARMDPPAGQRYLYGGAREPEFAAPFAPRWEYQPHGAGPRLGRADLAAIHSHAKSPLDKLAFSLDNILNNTSLVLLITWRGKCLLFPGDAQFGSWDSWLRGDDAAGILSQVDFYKVSHHGSANGTPMKAVEKLNNFTAMVSTQSAPFAAIPRVPLLDALARRGRCEVLRSDSLPVLNAPKGPELDKLPRCYERGELWFDHFLDI